jgi:hypothetical protein
MNAPPGSTVQAACWGGSCTHSAVSPVTHVVPRQPHLIVAHMNLHVVSWPFSVRAEGSAGCLLSAQREQPGRRWAAACAASSTDLGQAVADSACLLCRVLPSWLPAARAERRQLPSRADLAAPHWHNWLPHIGGACAGRETEASRTRRNLAHDTL